MDQAPGDAGARVRRSDVPLPDLAGTSEVATLLGVSRQRLSEIRKNASLGFPRPVVELAAGPVWLSGEVEAWLEGWDRKPGRPKARREADAQPEVEEDHPVSVEVLPPHLL